MRPRIGLAAAENPALLPGKHIINTPYIDAIFAAGGTPVLVPVGGGPERARDYIGILDGLLLPGGEDVTPNLYGEEPRPQVTYMNEDRDRMEMELLALALERRLPVFGICRGMQLVAAALGGALYQDLPTQRPGSVAHSQDRSIRAQLTHRVTLAPGSVLEELLGKEPLRVNSYHHQAVKTPSPGFQITAWAADGVAEGMENQDGSVYAVQWHPEELVERCGRFRPLFRRLVELAGAR